MWGSAKNNRNMNTEMQEVVDSRLSRNGMNSTLYKITKIILNLEKTHLYL